MTLTDPPAETTHWTAARWRRRPASASARSSASGARTACTAPGPAVQAVERSAVRRETARCGRALSRPPAHAIVLWVDEKSQIQALDRTQPGLPMKKGRAGTMTHDYKRHGTTTLFAALNVLDGTVIGRNMAGIAIKSSSASSTPSRLRSRRISRSTPSSTTTPHTNTRRSARGSTAIPAGPSTSCRHPAHGSTPSRASSPSSPSGG